MDKQALETKLHFSQPIRQIIMMMLAIGLASIGLFMALNDVIAVVTANLYLNGFIFLYSALVSSVVSYRYSN